MCTSPLHWLALLAGTAVLVHGTEHVMAEEAVYPGKSWPKKAAAEVGLDAAKLRAFSKYVGGRGCVTRHGYMVYTWGNASKRGDVASACKPWFSHFLFKAVEDGKIASLDDKVAALEPRLKGADRDITWRHLANQISCYGITEKPGTAFCYNDWQMALFWDLLFLKVYGVTYDTVDEKVVHPLLTDILQCEDRPTFMAFGTRNRAGRVGVSPRDFCRFGLLYLHKGNWKGKQLLGEKHAVMAVTTPLPLSIPRAKGKAAEMIRRQRSMGSGRIPDNQCDHVGSYSWLWWTNGMDREGKRHWPGVPEYAYGCFGHGGRRAMVVVPSLDLVMSWNDTGVRGREKESRALKLLVEAVVSSLRSGGAGIHFPPPGESMAQQDRRTPNAVGLKPGIVEHLRAKTGKGRWALWRHGYLVHVEGNFNQKTEVKSLRKTWHALTVGAAIKQGKIPSYEQKISVWNKDLTGEHAEATWRHVITQTSGFDYPYGGYPAYKPGEMWTYSDKNPKHLCNALARAYGKKDYYDHYDDVIRAAYFDALGMRGWKTSTRKDGIRFHFDLEDMGRLGLLVLARGRWNGVELIPQWFVEELETKQTRGALVNYDGPDDGKIDRDPKAFPEAPYGFMTWVNTDGDCFPGADTAWACAAGAGRTYIFWNRNNGIVFAGVGVDTGSTADGILHVIEAGVSGANPLVRAGQ